MTDPIDQLRSALADRYKIEREIGAGGMATVYLAVDLKHRRHVAVKVLRPDLAATMGPDRFLREIEIAAQLHHPHITPLYDSGEADGFLYYVMPYEEGQSLREKLAKHGELPVPEAVRVLRHVVDALAHAHQQGVVHRDIKPENIMLSGEHAMVTDFGVAKAVSEATGRRQLTTEGVALGTPAYMAPEQASADPNIDQRADIYAVGIVAYELLTGQPPFTGTTVQQVLAAHFTQDPEPVSTYRDRVPPALEALVMRCLEKKPADRWQTAEELRVQLDALATPSGGVTPTAHVTPRNGVTPGRPAMRWPVYAVVAALLFVLAGTVGITRSVKVGRAGTLIGQELLAEHDLLLVAEFENRTADSLLGATVTDAIRVELQQSSVVEVLGQQSMWDGMRRMGLDPGAELPDAQVRELAERENAKAYVTGDVSRLGSGYQITARVIATAGGGEVLTVRVTAQDDGQLIGAVEELSRKLRGDIGESLHSVRAAPPLAQVTTASLPALRAFMAGKRAENDGDRPRAIALLRQAVDLDSTFAMAWRALSAVYGNDNRYGPSLDASTRAYVFRDRLPELERLQVAALYHSRRGEYELAAAAYQRLIDLEPQSAVVLVGYADLMLKTRRWEEAEAVARRAIEVDPQSAVGYWNLAEAQIVQRRFAAADSTLARMGRNLPGSSWLRELRPKVMVAARDFETAQVYWDSLDASGAIASDELNRVQHCYYLPYRGRLRAWERCRRLNPMTAWPALRYVGDTVGVRRLIDAEWASMRAGGETRWAPVLIALLAEMGMVSDARQFLDEWQELVGPDDPGLRVEQSYAAGAIALAEGNADSAATAFLAWNQSGYAGARYLFNRGFAEAGTAMDRAGRPDSAIVLYERALMQPTIYAQVYEIRWYPLVLHRLGELHEAAGHREQAIEYYGRFISLWRDADPELQPQVADAKMRLARLVGEPE